MGKRGSNKPDVNRASKQIITTSAMNYANAKQIPLQKRFSTRKSEMTDTEFKLKNYVPNWISGLFSPVNGAVARSDNGEGQAVHFRAWQQRGHRLDVGRLFSLISVQSLP